MGLSNFLEDAFLNWAMRGTAMPSPAPSAWWVALHTEDPTDDGSAGELVDSVDPSFVRKSVTFLAAASGVSVSDSDVTWTPTNPGNHTVTHVSVWDDETAGNLLFHGPLYATRVVTNTSPLTIAAGDLQAALD